MYKIKEHLGHSIVVAEYAYVDKTVNYAIECMDCMEIIIDDEETE